MWLSLGDASGDRQLRLKLAWCSGDAAVEMAPLRAKDDDVNLLEDDGDGGHSNSGAGGGAIAG